MLLMNVQFVRTVYSNVLQHFVRRCGLSRDSRTQHLLTLSVCRRKESQADAPVPAIR